MQRKVIAEPNNGKVLPLTRQALLLEEPSDFVDLTGVKASPMAVMIPSSVQLETNSPSGEGIQIKKDDSRENIVRILKAEIPNLHRLLSIAAGRYEEESIVENSEAILNLITSLRGLIKDLIVLSERDKMLDRIDKFILRQLLTSTVKACAQAANDLKTSIKRGGDVDASISSMLTGIGSKLNTEYMRSLKELGKIIDY